MAHVENEEMVYILLYVVVYTKVAVVQQNRSKMWDGVEFVGEIAIECEMK